MTTNVRKKNDPLRRCENKFLVCKNTCLITDICPMKPFLTIRRLPKHREPMRKTVLRRVSSSKLPYLHPVLRLRLQKDRVEAAGPNDVHRSPEQYPRPSRRNVLPTRWLYACKAKERMPIRIHRTEKRRVCVESCG